MSGMNDSPEIDGMAIFLVRAGTSSIRSDQSRVCRIALVWSRAAMHREHNRRLAFARFQYGQPCCRAAFHPEAFRLRIRIAVVEKDPRDAEVRCRPHGRALETAFHLYDLERSEPQLRDCSLHRTGRAKSDELCIERYRKRCCDTPPE